MQEWAHVVMAREAPRSSDGTLETQERHRCKFLSRFKSEAGEDQRPSLKTGRGRDFALTQLCGSVLAFM